MRKHLLATLSTTALLALTTVASASPVNWNFGEHIGDRGPSQTYDSGPFTLTARGFTLLDVATNVFSKTGGTDETGLGLSNDGSGNDEIQSGMGFLQINLDGLLSRLSGFQFSMSSTTQGEGWAVFGSMDTSPFTLVPLLTSGVDDEALHNLPGGWDNYNFFYNGPGPGLCGSGCNANVLLASFDALSAVPGPIVGAGLPGLIAGAFAMMGLGWKRRQRAA